MNMPRKAREKSNSKIYHVMLRGINKQAIFEEDMDYQYFLSVLMTCRDISHFILYAYCLMNNHVHLLIREGDEDDAESMEVIFKRIGVRYSNYYNHKYGRIGHLFQDRYKSEPCEDMLYFRTLLAYIHRNPVEAGICNHPWEYPWSSWHEYMNGGKLCAVWPVLARFSSDTTEAQSILVDLCSRPTADSCLDIDDNFRMTDNEAREILASLCDTPYAGALASWEGEERDTLIRVLACLGVGIRQISRITGWSYGVVRKCVKETGRK